MTQTLKTYRNPENTYATELVDLPSEFIDEFATHSALKEKLDIYYTDGGFSMSDSLGIDREQLVEDIMQDAHDLAAQILPKEISEELGIQARIEDNAGIHHPPSLKDVEMLGHAWDVTGDAKTLEAIKIAITQVDSPEAPIALEAIEKAEQGVKNFATNYVKGVESQIAGDAAREIDPKAKLDSFDEIDHIQNPKVKQKIVAAIGAKIDQYTTMQTVAYIDANPAAPTYETYIDAKKNLSTDEVEERLVEPLPFPDIELEQASGDHPTDSDGTRLNIPLVMLPSKVIIKNARIHRLTDIARNEAVSTLSEETVEKVRSMHDIIHTPQGIAPEYEL
jgi:hypothetical protein